MNLRLLPAVFAIAFTSGAQAQLLTWDLAGVNSPSTALATTIDGDLDISSGLNELSRTGVLQATANNSFNSNTWNITSTFDEADKYISFTLAPLTGYEMTLTSLQYVVNGSNTGPGTGRWGYSVNGGSFVLQDAFNLTFALPSSLGEWDFNDFTTDQSVEFRFWAFGSTAINSGSTVGNAGAVRVANIAGNDLVLNGSVSVIPEPSTVGLLGLAALGLATHVLRRRRR
jgi:hypothetical protein